MLIYLVLLNRSLSSTHYRCELTQPVMKMRVSIKTKPYSSLHASFHCRKSYSNTSKTLWLNRRDGYMPLMVIRMIFASRQALVFQGCVTYGDCGLSAPNRSIKRNGRLADLIHCDGSIRHRKMHQIRMNWGFLPSDVFRTWMLQPTKNVYYEASDSMNRRLIIIAEKSEKWPVWQEMGGIHQQGHVLCPFIPNPLHAAQHGISLPVSSSNESKSVLSHKWFILLLLNELYPVGNGLGLKLKEARFFKRRGLVEIKCISWEQMEVPAQMTLNGCELYGL